MTYKISLSMEDAEGGSWDDDDTFVCESASEDDIINAAIDRARDEFNPCWDASGKDVPGPIAVRAEVEGFDFNIHLSDNGDDISIY